MAKATLPTNFKDDILSNGMSGKRRYNMIQNSDGTVSLEDVTDYTQVGSTFGAVQINATNEAVNNAADASKIIDDLDTIKANTQSGYIAGALAVKALDSNLSKKKIATACARVSGSTIAEGSVSITVPSDCKKGVLIADLYSYNASTGFTISITNTSGIKSKVQLLDRYNGGYPQSAVTSVWDCEFNPNSTITIYFKNGAYSLSTFKIMIAY